MQSRQSKYGLRALLVLAREAGRGPMLIAVGESRGQPEQCLRAEVRVLGGTPARVPCVRDTAQNKCVECLDDRTYGVRLAMKEALEATARVFDQATWLI